MHKRINAKQYQTTALETASYEAINGKSFLYPALGLAGEVGEVIEKIKKIYRDDGGTINPSSRYALVMELGDVMWFVAALKCEFSGHIQTEQDASRKRFDLSYLGLTMHIAAGRISEKILVVPSAPNSGPDSFLNAHLAAAAAEINEYLNTITTCVHHIADIIDVPFVDILNANIQKLVYRKTNGKLSGSGDYR